MPCRPGAVSHSVIPFMDKLGGQQGLDPSRFAKLRPVTLDRLQKGKTREVGDAGSLPTGVSNLDPGLLGDLNKLEGNDQGSPLQALLTQSLDVAGRHYRPSKQTGPAWIQVQGSKNEGRLTPGQLKLARLLAPSIPTPVH